MGSSRIEKIIDDIYEFVESCKPMAFSQTKVVVPKDELFDLLDELKLRTPDEIKKSLKVIAMKDKIIADAQEDAQGIISETKLKADRMVNDSDIVTEAYRRADEIMKHAQDEANEIIMEANRDAGQIRTGALSYAEDMLGEVEKVISHAYDTTKGRCDSLVESLRGNLEVLVNNRNEITAELKGTGKGSGDDGDGDNDSDDDDFDFDEDTFLEDIDQDE